jgi:hypothetical protein
MEDLIMLGQIPGTSLHITFLGWLIAAALLSLIYALYHDFRHNRHLLFGLFYLSINLSKRRFLQHLDEIAL